MANEQPRYRIPETGAEFEYEGIPGPHMQPLNVAALAMFAKYLPTKVPEPAHGLPQTRRAPTTEQLRFRPPDLEKLEKVRNVFERAKQFLIVRLTAGPIASKKIRAKAKSAGHSWRTIQRAARALNIEASKKGAGCWVWRLPENARAAEDRQSKTG